MWERLFQCNDLGKDLVPVVNAFKSSEQIKTKVPLPELAPGGEGSQFRQNYDSDSIAPPVDLLEWIDGHMDAIVRDGSIDLYVAFVDKFSAVTVQTAPHNDACVQLYVAADTTRSLTPCVCRDY